MVGDEHGVKAVAFCQAGCNCQHNAIAEGHHGTLHIFCVIIIVGNICSAFKDAALEILADEVYRDNQMLDAQFFAVVLRAGCLGLVLPCAVRERNGQGDISLVFIKEAGAVHAAGIYQYCFHCYLVTIYKVINFLSNKKGDSEEPPLREAKP